MKILITGAGGFIGSNLRAALKYRGSHEVLAFTHDLDDEVLRSMCAECAGVVHLAGVNRPERQEDFAIGNTGLTEKLLRFLEETENPVPLIYSSSTRAAGDDPYGASKKKAEDLINAYGKRNDTRVFVYRLPNVFGKWSRPEYNSAVATFCYHTARHEPIRIDDRTHTMKLLYIDDIVTEFLEDIDSFEKEKTYRENEGGVEPLRSIVYETDLGFVADTISSFGKLRENLDVPDLSDPLTSKLYSTYLSFLPPDELSYDLKMNCDERGSFTEFLRNKGAGQVSVNISHPGITKGQHWHDSKNEKFLVVRGKGLIRFRRLGEEKIYDYHVNGDKLQVVEIPTGYTHCIINEGDEDMVTVMWANEPFNPENPDTYHEEV
ncbi:MAG: NAD-dependent epimerase/dehydratase family protein [Lachnospiraceae bacterium]|nr:NAD-dependent epimerase/dehydratase family protein [Lachnospiraceae bacterium]